MRDLARQTQLRRYYPDADVHDVGSPHELLLVIGRDDLDELLHVLEHWRSRDWYDIDDVNAKVAEQLSEQLKAMRTNLRQELDRLLGNG